MESFSEWLLEELKSRDMSQSDLARVSHLGRGTISNILSGNRNVGQESLIKIAHALKLPPSLVFQKAGILPSKNIVNEKIEKINHALADLPEEEQEDILEYINLRIKLAEERAAYKAARKRNNQALEESH